MTEILKLLVACVPALSVNATLTVLVPPVEGARPETTPAELTFTQVEPETFDHVYGLTPPVAANCAE